MRFIDRWRSRGWRDRDEHWNEDFDRERYDVNRGGDRYGNYGGYDAYDRGEARGPDRGFGQMYERDHGYFGRDRDGFGGDRERGAGYDAGYFDRDRNRDGGYFDRDRFARERDDRGDFDRHDGGYSGRDRHRDAGYFDRDRFARERDDRGYFDRGNYGSIGDERPIYRPGDRGMYGRDDSGRERGGDHYDRDLDRGRMQHERMRSDAGPAWGRSFGHGFERDRNDRDRGGDRDREQRDREYGRDHWDDSPWSNRRW